MPDHSPALYLLGGGGHARSLIATLRLAGIPCRGILDPDLEAGATVAGVPVLGGDEILGKLDPATSRIVLAVGVGRDTSARCRLDDLVRRHGLRFATIVHPSAICDPNCRLGEGAQILAGAILHVGSRVGENAVVNTGAIIDHDCEIGDLAFIGPGATLCGGVRVGRSALIGAGAVLLPEAAIPSGAMVRAGTVVRKGSGIGMVAAFGAGQEDSHD